MNTFKIFVYGTLKKGFPNFRHYCKGAVSIEPAKVKGRMYDLGFGFPMMELPSGPADTDWDWIQGELMAFDDAEPSRIQWLDLLEGYRPGDDTSLYLRVKAPIWVHEKEETAWLGT